MQQIKATATLCSKLLRDKQGFLFKALMHKNTNLKVVSE